MVPFYILLSILFLYVSNKFKLDNFLSKRPIPLKVSGLGTWNHILIFMNIFSVISNIVLFAFASD